MAAHREFREPVVVARRHFEAILPQRQSAFRIRHETDAVLPSMSSVTGAIAVVVCGRSGLRTHAEGTNRGGASGGVAASPAPSNRQTVMVEEASVDPEPMTQLSSWLEVARAAGEPMPEAMSVATATTEGRPSSRMVLLRGIDQEGLVFYTDQESEKGQELKANPFAAALFHWFKPLHRQVRVTGAVEVVDASLSNTYWQSRPPGSRRSAVASHQSQVIAESSGARRERGRAGRNVS